MQQLLQELPMTLSTLRDLNIWSPSKTKGKKDKAPLLHIDKKDTHLNYLAANELRSRTKGSKFLGIMPSSNDPCIYLDYDIDPKDPSKHNAPSKAFTKFMADYPTYIETSAGGKGKRVIYKLGPQDCERARVLGWYTEADVSGPYTGQVYFNNGYVIITGNEDPNSTDIRTITLDELYPLLPTLKAKLNTTKPVSSATLSPDFIKAASATSIQESLDILPNHLNFYTKQAYKSLPNHTGSTCEYDFWREIGSAVAYAACITLDANPSPFNSNILQHYFSMWDQWSQGHPKYDEQETREKWDHLVQSTRQHIQSNEPATITHMTLHKLANGQTPEFSKGLIDNNNTFREIIDFHQLTYRLHAYNIEAACVECHKDVVKKLFPKDYNIFPGNTKDTQVVETLNPSLAAREVLFESGFKTTPTQLTKNYREYTEIVMVNNEPFDPFKASLLQVPKWRPGMLTIDDLVDTIIFDPTLPTNIISHCKEVLRRVLIYTVGMRFREGVTPAPCVPILFGRERTYKTTWVREILLGTEFFDKLTVDLSGFMSQPDRLARAMATGIIFILDEIETKLKNADNAKDMLLDDNIDYHVLQKSQRRKSKRLGTIWGTTNSAVMQASANGNRRYCRMAVQLCDTTKSRQLSEGNGKWEMFSHVLHIMAEEKAKGNLFPWELSAAMDRVNNDIMNSAKTETSLHILVRDYFTTHLVEEEFDPEAQRWIYGKRGGIQQPTKLRETRDAPSRLVSVTDFHSELIRHQPDVIKISVAELNRILRDFASHYTNSLNLGVFLGPEEMGDRRTSVKDGMIQLRGKKDELYFVPHRKDRKYE